MRKTVYNEELGFLSVWSYNPTSQKILVFKIDILPRWGCRVAVSPVDEIVVKDDAYVPKMIEFTHKMNLVRLLLSLLYFDREEKKVYVAFNMFFDEDPSDEEIELSIENAVTTLIRYEDEIRAVAAGDFSPLDEIKLPS